MRHAKFDTQVRTLVGYSANVKHLADRNYALLGNAGEFLDPVFSSGVTIALKSSSLAVPLVERVLQGQQVDWLEEYEKPLRRGIQVFRAYVESWYEGEFQDVVFSQNQNEGIRRMISSLLAGYAWDEKIQSIKMPNVDSAPWQNIVVKAWRKNRYLRDNHATQMGNDITQ